MPEIELPSGWVAWVGFIITVTAGLAIRDWASDLIAAWKWKTTPGFEPMETCIIFERNGEFGRTWQYIPSSKISNHELRRVVGDDRMLDHKIKGK